jgi:glucose/arabinose dehydrogenase
VVAAALLVPAASAKRNAAPAVVVRGLGGLTHLAAPASEPGRLYVVEQRGVIAVVVGGKLRRQPFLDIHTRVSCCGERGLLSVAFHPRYARNHLFYVDYTDTAGNSRVVEYRSNGRAAILSSARQVFYERQPFPNHNGGQLAFGPDGLLYIGLGDGGSGGDPNNNGQTFQTKLAKIWKLDVAKRGAQPQLVDYGLRNPWRFSFDRATGDLYIGDVGQSAWEEIDYVTRGRAKGSYFGWPTWEGRAVHDSSRQDPNPNHRPPIFPIEVKSHGGDGYCAIIGGFVVHNPDLSLLNGRYVYSDNCNGDIRSLKPTTPRAKGDTNTGLSVSRPSSFGVGPGGRLYVASLGDGHVYKVVQHP